MLRVFHTLVRAKLKIQHPSVLQVFVGTYPSILHCIYTVQRKRAGAVPWLWSGCWTSVDKLLACPSTIPQLFFCFPTTFKCSLRPPSSPAQLCPEPARGRCNPQWKKKGAINDGVQRWCLCSGGDLLRTVPKIIKSKSHGMVWVGRDLKAHPALPPAMGLLPPPAQAAHGPIQPGLEHLQEWGTTASLDSCTSASLPLVKNVFLIPNLNLSSFSLKSLPLVLSIQALI